MLSLSYADVHTPPRMFPQRYAFHVAAEGVRLDALRRASPDEVQGLARNVVDHWAKVRVDVLGDALLIAQLGAQMEHRLGLDPLDVVRAEEYGVGDGCVHADYTAVVAEELQVTRALLGASVHDDCVVDLALHLFLLLLLRVCPCCPPRPGLQFVEEEHRLDHRCVKRREAREGSA
eukprot:2610796-Prymnesium_polylepis.1